MKFDYLVIGAGTAGCVLANRLSGNSQNNVAIFEAGKNSDIWKVNMPLAILYTMHDPKYNYKYMEGNEKRNYDSYSNEHPIVRTHPETGKKILYVNWTYTKQIIGLEKVESDRILKEIFEHQARLDLTCRFSWTEDTVAIWDNRSVIHYAIADFFPGRGLGYERIMDRIAIEGDHPQ